jgi:hypothetical protein
MLRYIFGVLTCHLAKSLLAMTSAGSSVPTVWDGLPGCSARGACVVT